MTQLDAAELATQARLIVAALSDWGPCTPAELRRMGIPDSWAPAVRWAERLGWVRLSNGRVDVTELGRGALGC